jgi:hypothetical protein
MKISLFPKGTRVRVRPGRFPMDRALVGRTGLVLGHDRAVPSKVTVQLDGEVHLRTFTDDELEGV